MNVLPQCPIDEYFVLNLGPQHPATHGVLRVKLTMDGEYIVKAEPVLGYIHRMHEKLAEAGTFAQFMPNTARMDYLPATTPPDWRTHERARQLAAGEAVISLYARGRDYHKVMRQRLQQLAQAIAAHVGTLGHRVFTDSAPVLEVALASRSGLGWRGKHTLLVNKQAGSTFFLGEIYIDMALPATPATSAHCGNCQACISACPTGAIVAPWRLDARRCISYLTIEHAGAIPEELRPLLGNRVYGCDDCQLACPWNRFAVDSAEADFAVRNGLDDVTLVELFGWSEDDFKARLAGSPIYRIGYVRWLRNLAVGLGNAPSTPAVLAALQSRMDDPDPQVREHVRWALARN